MNIFHLEEKISKAETLLLVKQEEALKTNSFALSLSISSLASHIEELQLQLKEAKEERQKEIIELRLIGNNVNNGTVPIDTFANLLKTFSNFIFSASSKIKTGEDLSGAIASDVIKMLNLRFADITYGSSKLFITGDTSPDLFGESLLEDSLIGLFKLLNQDIDKGISEEVHYLGYRSIHNLSSFLKELHKKNIELDLTWKAPNEKKYFWKGNRNKIYVLQNMLDNVIVNDPVKSMVSGVIDTISRSGELKLKVKDEIIKISYPKQLYKEIKELRLEDQVNLSIEEVIIYNEATKEEKKKFNLLKIV